MLTPCAGPLTIVGLVVGSTLLLQDSRPREQSYPETRPGAGAGETRPSGLVGKEFGSLEDLRWLMDDGKAVPFSRHAATIVRWWTEGCPYCEASVPALSALRERNRERGLQLVAVYHAKPHGRDAVDANVRATAMRLGVSDCVAIDDQWRKLQSLWARGAPKEATSVTFLVDRKGIIRWVHPGPRLHPSGDGRHPRADADMKELERRVEELLGRER